VNNLGHIVGYYTQADGIFHGFLDIAGTFTTVDDPSATSGTGLSDINGSDQIVGSYNFTDSGHPLEGAHGFLLNGSTFSAIDYPAGGVTSTTPVGINDFGDVVGLYRMNSPGIGFLLSGGVYSSITFPGGCCTHAHGINNSGQIVGQYKTPDDTAPQQGFLKTGNTFTTINYPGATRTTLQGINNSGDIVGNARIASADFAFLYTGGNFFSIAFPGAIATQVGKLNDNDEIVGYYQDTGGLYHGFKATMTSPTPTPTPTPVSISGAISYCSNPSIPPVPGVTLTLTGDASGSTSSDGSGNYALSGLMAGGNYTVTPSKAARVPGSTGINTVDVIAIQRHFLNIVLLSGCRLTAADVNASGTIDTVDVIATQRFFLGLSTGIANTGKYQFSPANRTYTGLVTNQTGQNYDALIFGDVASPFAD
jgi:hypothetical protein